MRYSIVLALFFVLNVLNKCITCSISNNIESSWAESTLRELSLRQKIAQLCIVACSREELLVSGAELAFPYFDPHYVNKLIEEYHVGGIIFLGTKQVAEQITQTNEYQQRSKLPLLIMEDLEWGLSMRLTDAIVFPRNITLGALGDESLIYDLGKEIGRQCRAIGVHVNLAPVVDVNNNPKNPVIRTRSFGSDPLRVAQLATQLMLGMQASGVIACAKHFPGHGDTDVDSHKALPVINHDRARLDAIELMPFDYLIKQGVQATMLAHMDVPALDPDAITTFSYPIVTTLLQEELGFNGLVLTDALCMGALDQYECGELEVRALLAGNDLLLCSRDVPRAIDCIEQAVKQGLLNMEQLNTKVLKVLRAKEQLGIHNQRLVDSTDILSAINTSTAYALKKRLYQEAITLVQNNNNRVPLTHDCASYALVQLGSEYDSVFTQTINNKYPLRTLYGSSALTDNDINQILQELSSYTTIIVGLFDIKPSAKFINFGITDQTRKFIRLLKERGKQIILVLFGTPYALSLFGEEDAILIANEAEIEAQQAAAEVILGDRIVTGMLSVTLSEKFHCGLGLTISTK